MHAFRPNDTPVAQRSVQQSALLAALARISAQTLHTRKHLLLRSCCPMTTVDPDTITRDPEVLRDVGRRFGGTSHQGNRL